jgi:hypothetical protein
LGQGLLRLVVLAPLGFLLILVRAAQNTSDILEEIRKKP